MKYLLIDRDHNHGDAIMALPTICALAKQLEPEPLYLCFANLKVLELAELPSNVVHVMLSEPQWRNQEMMVQMLGVGAACNFDPCHATMHPIHFLMAWAGLDVDLSDLPQPRIVVPEMDVPAYDVVLAPWANAYERKMTPTAALELYATLQQSTIIVGGPNDPVIAPSRDVRDYHSIPRAYGQSFAYVVNLMRRAKVVVTTDSGPGRLAHAAGVGDRHIILDSGITPWRSQGHPGAVQVKGRIEAGQALWNIDDIVNAIKERLCVPHS